MQTKILAVTLALLFAPVVVSFAQEPAAEKPAESGESPEKLVERINELLNDDGPTEVVTEAQLAGILKKTIKEVDRIAAKFRQLSPEHPQRWQLRFHEAMMLSMREQAGMEVPKGTTVLSIFDEIIAAPDAAPDIKMSTASIRLEFLSAEVFEKRVALETWEKASADFMKAHPDYPDTVVIAEMHADLVSEFAPARLEALLAEYSANKNPVVAEMAQDKLVEVKQRAELKSKPLELKFTALDGREVDLEKLRGKVVLVDFWATWCGPCMAELPNLVKAYEALKGKGFEVIGISLDEEKAELEKIIKRRKVTWPQFFDGTGWDNKIAKRFGITAIPAMWLVDKKGVVVDMNVRGDVESKVEKLLSETAEVPTAPTAPTVPPK